jgi:rSAM/selenodomain-associated transferase 1
LKATALVLFGKVPLPGRVKTRLASSIGPENAALLSESFLRDASRGCASLAAGRSPGQVAPVLAADPPHDPFWAGAFPPPWRIEPQGEGDLGRRLARAFEREFQKYERVAVLGSDHPGLPLSEFGRFLDSPNAIWPTRDGGYAALILERTSGAARLFENVEWSTPAVLDQTLERARRSSIELEIFPETYDVDREDDLETLARDLEERDPAAPGFPRATWEALSALRPRRAGARRTK